MPNRTSGYLTSGIGGGGDYEVTVRLMGPDPYLGRLFLAIILS